MKKSLCLLLSFLFTVFLFAQKPIVKDLKAQTSKGNKIILTWTLPENPDTKIQSLLIYRSTKQISSYGQLSELSPLAELKADQTSYTDTLSDFKYYFYAVVAKTQPSYDLILLSFNSTVMGTHLIAKSQTIESTKTETEKFYPEGKLRESPLPFVDFSETPKNQAEISSDALSSTQDLINKSKEKETYLKPYIFEEDLVSPDAGDDYLLFEILKNSFVQKKYYQAITDLTKLSGTNINENTRNRAYFYTGEAYYFTGQFEEAVKSFVKVEQNFPVQTKKWLDSALSKIK